MFKDDDIKLALREDRWVSVIIDRYDFDQLSSQEMNYIFEWIYRHWLVSEDDLTPEFMSALFDKIRHINEFGY